MKKHTALYTSKARFKNKMKMPFYSVEIGIAYMRIGVGRRMAGPQS